MGFMYCRTLNYLLDQEFNQQRIVTICIASKLVLALRTSFKQLSGMQSKSMSICTSPNALVSCFTCCSVICFAGPKS